ncbi:hypothetical protein MRX96_033673 [Rhipicephalus microplus]
MDTAQVTTPFGERLFFRAHANASHVKSAAKENRPVTAASAANSVCTRWGQHGANKPRQAKAALPFASPPPLDRMRGSRTPHVRLFVDSALDCACCVSKHVFLLSFSFPPFELT